MQTKTAKDKTQTQNSAALLAERARRRDFFVLGSLFVFVCIILSFSGSLTIGEAITALIVFVFGALAYYLSTVSTSRETAIYTEFAAQRREQFNLDAGATRLSAAGLRDDIRSIIEAYPQPCLLAGLDGRVYIANEGAQNVFKLPRSGAIGPSIIRRPDVLRRLEVIAEGRTPGPLDIEITGTPDRFFQVRSEPMTILGDDRVLLVLIELTELRRAQKARADFLANASHELRTPLTSLAGFIETMRGPAKDDPEAWDRFLEIMYGQTERMRRLINDLLSLSRIELSEHNKPDKIVEFGALVEETFEAMLPIARDREVTLDFIGTTREIHVFGVHDELTQVLQNLIENALKYTRKNTSVLIEMDAGLTLDDAKKFISRKWDNAARISILQSHIDQKDMFVAVRVSDQGAGIGREHLPRLGERFYRVDEGRDRRVGGTGLGLAIVKHILARHRGGLTVESEEGRGSAFGFWLPVYAMSPAGSSEKPTPDSKDTPDEARPDPEKSF